MRKDHIKKPPIGLMPKSIHDDKRLREIREAVLRYHYAGLPVPMRWIKEYDDLSFSKN